MLFFRKTAEPVKEFRNGLFAFVIDELEEIVDKDMGDVIISGMDPADCAFQEFIRTDVINTGITDREYQK